MTTEGRNWTGGGAEAALPISLLLCSFFPKKLEIWILKFAALKNCDFKPQGWLNEARVEVSALGWEQHFSRCCH